ncbi:hypothetical protein [Streptomyces sp. NPDC047009]|uniref:hypothetical protein n=1 Tax=unclassified Streptomyces TaxID=2593676 RepID=UPI00340AFCAC
MDEQVIVILRQSAPRTSGTQAVSSTLLGVLSRPCRPAFLGVSGGGDDDIALIVVRL